MKQNSPSVRMFEESSESDCCAEVPDSASSNDERALDEAFEKACAKELDDLDREADDDWNPHSEREKRGASLSVSPFGRSRRSTGSASGGGHADAKGDGSESNEDGDGRSKSTPPRVRRVLKPARKKGWNSMADKECPVDGCGYGRLFKMARYSSL